MVVVRRAGPGDAAAVGAVHSASWAAAYAPLFAREFGEAGVRDRRGRWVERLADPVGVVLIAEVDGRALAMTHVVADTSGGAEILSFYGHPDGWGTGVAVALMDATVAHLRADGVTTVRLWTLRDTTQSRRFYAKTGFAETGATRTHDFGDGRPLPQVEYARPLGGVSAARS